MKKLLYSHSLAFIVVILIFFETLATACSPDEPDEIQKNNSTISYEKVIGGLKIPWGMVFLPSGPGDMLITERKGEIRRVSNWILQKEPIEGVPEVYTNGQGGLLDIELHPHFEENGWLYLSYSSPEGSGSGGNTAIMRARLEGNTLVDQQILYKATPNTRAGAHFGSRLEFDKNGYLFFSIGDRYNRSVNPQKITRDGGKIYRIHDDGSIPQDNPFINQSKAKTAIYSYGHRNPQGLAMHPTTGEIWSNEHGPKGGDEVNLIKPGGNYGWPVISYGINYNGTKFTVLTAKAGMEQPVIYWVPSIAPCGMTFVSGDTYPGWDGDLLVSSLKFNYLVHCTVDGHEITHQEIIAKGIGRVRNVRQGPDGYLYVAVEGKGIYRLLVE